MLSIIRVSPRIAAHGSRLTALFLLCTPAMRCATAPEVTEATRRIAANPPAIVEGVVRDEAGRPVGGIGVRGIPRGKDIPWSPPATTGCDGRFRLSLPAPATYAFLLLWNEKSVSTEDPSDPARIEIPVTPGEERRGLDLTLLRGRWEDAAGEFPGRSAACP